MTPTVQRIEERTVPVETPRSIGRNRDKLVQNIWKPGTSAPANRGGATTFHILSGTRPHPDAWTCRAPGWSWTIESVDNSY